MGYIYCLFSTQDGRPRYIGQTDADPERRLKQHLAAALDAESTAPVHGWVRDVLRTGFLVDIFVLQTDVVPKELRLFEDYWIQQFPDLLNHPPERHVSRTPSPTAQKIIDGIAQRVARARSDAPGETGK